MKIEVRRSTKLMAGWLVLTLGWFLFPGFDLDCIKCPEDRTKADRYPLEWVTCIGNKPTLMRYFSNFPVPVSDTTSGSFNPNDWDCSHPNSPAYKNSQKAATPPYPASGPSGPLSRPRAANSGFVSYLPPILRDLPFMPPIPDATPACDSSFPDVFQTVHNSSKVTRISTCPFQIKTTINVVSRPLQIEVTPDGSTALVTSFDNAVNFIDLATNKVVFTLRTDDLVNPDGIAISPDGTRAYITSFDPDYPVVQVIDLATRKVTATFMTPLQYPQGATLTPDGSQLWITGPLDFSVPVFDTLTNTLATTLSIGLTTDVAFNATGTRAYITSQTNSPGRVVVVDTATFQTVKTYTVGAGPTDIAMSYGDRFLVVNNQLDGSVSVIDLGQDKVFTAKVGANPSGIAFVH